MTKIIILIISNFFLGFIIKDLWRDFIKNRPKRGYLTHKVINKLMEYRKNGADWIDEDEMLEILMDAETQLRDFPL